ncbi:hypothetical protein ACSMXN_21920 [Jatrophihabitans sp. DSM 45814]
MLDAYRPHPGRVDRIRGTGAKEVGHGRGFFGISPNLNHGGRIAMFGLPSERIQIDWGKVVTHMITIENLYGRDLFDTWYAMSPTLAAGLDVSHVIPRRFPASRWAEGFATARGGQCGKVVLDWTVFFLPIRRGRGARRRGPARPAA